jgi:hypothetical protein
MVSIALFRVLVISSRRGTLGAVFPSVHRPISSG